jgi:hypothetical protein
MYCFYYGLYIPQLGQIHVAVYLKWLSALGGDDSIWTQGSESDGEWRKLRSY